jgi:hypothetical protein
MNREESVRIINAFITELERRNGTTPVAQPAPSLVPQRNLEHSIPLGVPRKPEAESQVAPTMFSRGFEVGARAPAKTEPPAPAPARADEGLGSLIKGCAGFEIGSSQPAAPPVAAPKPQAEDGLGTLMRGCAGFEIGGCQPPAPTAEPKPVAQAAPPPPPPPSPPAGESAETLAIRKAAERIGNISALLGLLQHYLSEAQKPTPNRLVLRTTKDQVMKHFPQLAFSQLIPALDGAAG